MTTPPNLLHVRLRNSRLTGPLLDTPEAVVGWFGAVQAQDYHAARWGIGQRVRKLGDGDAQEAYAQGRILRTHILRPTWHFVLPEDIRWMLALTAPRVRAAMAYQDRLQELDARVYRKSNAAIARALADGEHLTRDELAQALNRAGIVASGTRLAHLVIRAELDGLIVSGQPRGKQHTYAHLEQRVPAAKARTRDEALAELARRYFTSHGPAETRDFAWWSGLTSADARAGIELAKAALRRQMVDGKTYWLGLSKTTPALRAPKIHLLPNYDEYLVAFQDHALFLDPAVRPRARKLYDLVSRHVITRNGMLIGGWRPVRSGRRVELELETLTPLTRREADLLDAEAERYRRFLGVELAAGSRR